MTDQNSSNETVSRRRHLVSWLAREPYDVILVLLLAGYLLASTGSALGGFLVFVSLASVVATLAVAGLLPFRGELATAVICVALVLGLLDYRHGGAGVKSAALAMAAAISLICIFAIARRVLSHTEPGWSVLAASICAYLLIGTMFANLYMLIGLQTNTPFFVSGEHLTRASANYFSFVILSTLGFGDLTTHIGGARALVTLEAIFGQFYLATVVAQLVSSFSSAKPNPDSQGDAKVKA